MAQDNRAFGYLRVSGKAQVDGDGFQRQELAIMDFARRHNFALVHIFREKGVSGEIEGIDRPEFNEMISQMIASGVKVCIAEALHRVARDLMVQETAIELFRRNSLELRSADPAESDLLASDPSRVLIRQIMGAVSQYEKNMLVLKLKGARLRKRLATGRCEGCKPYSNQAVLDRIHLARIAGKSLWHIASRLNSDQVPAPRGGLWTAQTVSRLAKIASRAAAA